MSSEGPEFTARDVAAHRSATDAWMVIHGEVYDVSKYINDHPGGAEVLIEAAGTDASEAFDNAGHSEDAFEIMAEYRIGKLKGSGKKSAPKRVRLVTEVVPRYGENNRSQRAAPKAIGAAAVTFGAVGLYCRSRLEFARRLPTLPKGLIPDLPSLKIGRSRGQGLGFLEGFLAASVLVGITSAMISQKLMKLIHTHSTFMNYPPHVRLPKKAKQDLLHQGGWLDPSTYQSLPLAKKELVAPNTYRFVFHLPTPSTVLGLPTGQHVSIAAVVDSQAVTRSYTPISNNADLGVLELVIKCYPNGLLTGGYLANLQVGDEVQFRGPKGGMRYRRGVCRKIGMLAGGSGITPMYQLIRAICQDDRDTTEVSLIYANRTEEDILLRTELQTFARRYPKNFKLYYLLDQPPAEWAYGRGYVTRELMAERFPAPGPESKIMICGPPGMVNASKKALVQLGFEQPKAISKMGDQVFCF
ncbi:hypothetical protein DL764_000422 [Monosporascus ibericus]|uniref:Cytochrome-b5 reductase n=1 Tax=Monosporascus ibericus TaxID=155417 RepID=A0A4Q4TYQ7_9PEZI|nr:hypothetical protein DL764_000422 [Monosporascus ibericus]